MTGITYWLIHEIRRGNLDSAELGLEGQDNSAVFDAFPLPLWPTRGTASPSVHPEASNLPSDRPH